MSDTLVDSNVLVDVFNDDPQWEEWSAAQIDSARRTGSLVVNPLIYAEVCGGYPTQRQTDQALTTFVFRRENLPWEAAFNASRAFIAYRRSGGMKRSPLPDFYIGAHAEVRGYALLTRDPGRYRAYFPTLKIIAPDTHP
jgi:predicted nucleic acid-binding protein